MLYGNLKELFEISLGAEHQAKKLYEDLALKFKDHPTAPAFFYEMAADEDLHIKVLEGIRQGLSADALDKLAPKKTMIIAKKFLNFSADLVNENIQTLDDALRAVVNFEFSEANKLHELLMEMHEDDEGKMLRFRESLKAHQDKVALFKNTVADPQFKP